VLFSEAAAAIEAKSKVVVLLCYQTNGLPLGADSPLRNSL
jgi:hypothetical protein